MIACAPSSVSLSLVWATPYTWRMLTWPRARPAADVSGKRLLLWPSMTMVPVIAPPPSLVSAMTADFRSLMSSCSMGMGVYLSKKMGSSGQCHAFPLTRVEASVVFVDCGHLWVLVAQEPLHVDALQPEFPGGQRAHLVQAWPLAELVR